MLNETIGVCKFPNDPDRRTRAPSASSGNGRLALDERLILSRKVIELAVTRVFGVDQAQLSTFTRGVARAAHARQVAMYLAHVAGRMTLTDVGRMFGRDRTTVAHACAVIEDARDDPVFDRALDLLEWAVPVMATRMSTAPGSG
ncbi:MAG TPA: helix-turn-helix domain-containing protein [Hyphomicrobium sp.]|nr:helix-turn-helix domain-containing protein [Hyphomicrobium sp.]